MRIRSGKLDLEKNKFDPIDGTVVATLSTYQDELKVSSFDKLKQINQNHERGAEATVNVVYLDFTNQMTNVMVIPDFFK